MRFSQALQEYLPHLLAIIKCTECDGLLVRSQPSELTQPPAPFLSRCVLTIDHKLNSPCARSLLFSLLVETNIVRWRDAQEHWTHRNVLFVRVSHWSGPDAVDTRSNTDHACVPSCSQYELVFVLLTYALALANHATTLVHNLGTYERDASVSEQERKRNDEQVNLAAETLCRAAGVLHHLSEVVIPAWEGSAMVDLRSRPPEATREVTSALSKICLADAEKLAIRRLLSKSVAVAQATITPGPPLPRSHPSPSLLSKLYLNVHSLYDSSRSLAKSVGSTSSIGSSSRNILSSIKRDKNGSSGASRSGRVDDMGYSIASTSGASDGISQELRTYLSDGRTISSSLAYRWLGVDAGENANKTGDAIAWLSMAKTGLTSLQSKSSGKGLRAMPTMRKGKVEREKRKDRLVEELEDIEAFLRSYKRTNDTVLFQPIPSETSLLSQVPAGRSVLSMRPFSMPAAAFAARRSVEASTTSQDSILAAHTARSLGVQPAKPGSGVRDAGAVVAGIGSDSDSDDASDVDMPLQQSNYF